MTRLLLSALFLLPALAPRPAEAAPPAIRGVSLGHHTDIRPSVLEKKLREIKALGATHVTIVVSWSTDDVRSSTIAPRAHYATSDDKLGLMIDRAHSAGLKVLLFPLLDVRKRKPLEWRGTIRPTNWQIWWSQYHRFTLHYAKLAAKHRAEIFCVGSELVSTEGMRDRWKQLIGLVRQRYTGKLLYSANWDHYEPVAFWDLVDVVGLTAYYRIATDREATAQQMKQSWDKVRQKLVSWSRRIRRPIVFTEVGYPSLDGGAVDPWDYTQGTQADPEEQRRAYSAFVASWGRTPELAGVFFWDWYGEGGPKDRRYTPRGKPAEQVIRSWFSLGPDAAAKPK